MKYFLILLIIFSGCASNKANRKLKRAEKLIAQAEQLGAVWKIDTVYKKIPVYIDSVRVDSIFTAKPGDTVYLEKERLKIKFIRLAPDSFKIEGKCDTVTVYKNVPYIVNKEINTGIRLLTVVQWSILALIVGAVLARIFWK